MVSPISNHGLGDSLTGLWVAGHALARSLHTKYWGTTDSLTMEIIAASHPEESLMEMDPPLSTMAPLRKITIMDHDGHPFIPGPSRLLIREEYLLAINELLRRVQEDPKGGSILIGHPGIGV